MTEPVGLIALLASGLVKVGRRGTHARAPGVEVGTAQDDT